MNVRLTPDAIEGLNRVTTFAETLHGPLLASNLYNTILERCYKLATRLNIGQVTYLTGIANRKQYKSNNRERMETIRDSRMRHLTNLIIISN